MPNALESYRLIQELIHQGGSVTGQMAKLLDEFESSLPSKDMAALRALDYESEESAITARLQSGVAAAPSVKTLGGLYFGLFLPGREDGSIAADFYLAATDEHDPADAECHWVSSLDYFPSGAQAQSQVLERIYRLLPRLPEDVRTTAEDVLCLGYTGFVVARILNAPVFRAWCAEGRVIPVAVGWDSGSVLRVGELTANGFHAPEPAKKSKPKTKGSGLDHISKLGGVVHFVPPSYEPPPSPPRVDLYPVESKGWYGYINPAGEMVIEPNLSNANDFSEGLAAIKRDGLWGFINAAGEAVIEPRFTKCGSFHCGLAAVDDGFINPNGELVVPWRHKNANLIPGFSCDRAILDTPESNTEWVCIDKRGKRLFSGTTLNPTGYRDGLLHLPFCKPGSVFLDREGRKAMELPAYQRGRGFDMVGHFSEGLSALHMGKNGHGYMDLTGRIVFRLKRGQVGPNNEFSECRAIFWHDGKFGFVDREGNEVVAPRYKTAWPFSSGLACVSLKEAKGFIALDGALQIPCRFDFISNFRGELAAVVEKGKIKHINRAGETVWPR